MSYCLNPQCQNPQNSDDVVFCRSCGARLQLKERYRAIQLLGEGGFGRTFIAEDSDRLNTPCVIKQFLPLPQVQQNSGLLEKATEMFTQEARQLLQLGAHLQIPMLFADFEQDGRLYLVQEFIDGQNLLQELDERSDQMPFPYTGEEIEEILLNLLPVLKYIHDAGVIHRDIKPENILRRQSNGQLVLIDFGVAKQLSGSVLIKTGTKIGTEGYAPIEQLRGGKAYPASDLYSLGVTCIHLLTDIPPDELYDPMNGRWLWREELNKKGINISDRIGKVLDKLVQEWVSDRYQSAEEAIADLYWSSPLLQPLISSLPSSNQNSNAMNPVYSTLPSLGGKHSGNNLSPLPRHYSSNASPLPTPYRIPQTWKCVHTLTGHSNYVISVVISPNGQTLASCSYDKTIKVWHLETGHLLGTISAHTRWVSCLAMSPNGQILASGSLDNTIKLWHIGSGDLIRTITDISGYVISLAISPDGQILVGGSFDNTIYVWELATGNRIGTLTGHTGYIECVAISPDSQTLASGGGFEDHTIHLWDLGTGTLKTTLKGHFASVRSLAFSADGTRMVSGSEDKTIQVWDVARGEMMYTLPKQSAWVQAIAMSHYPKMGSQGGCEIFASGSRDHIIKLWHLDSGELLCVLKWHSGPVTCLAFSPDGNRLASGSWDKTIKIWQAE